LNKSALGELQSVRLGDVLIQSSERVSIQPFETYQEVTVRLNGKGAFRRRIVAGSYISSEDRNLAREGQLIMSKIDARNGALAIVPPELDLAVVSKDFPLFNLDTSRLLPGFLGLLIQADAFVSLCQKASEGSTNRVRIRESLFLDFMINLPSLKHQDRIVEKLGGALSRLREAQRLNDEVVSDVDRLLVALAHRDDLTESEKLGRGWRYETLSTVVRLDLDPVPVSPSEQYPNLGIYSYARGVFAKGPLSGLGIAAQTLYRVRSGQFIYLKLKAFEGAFGYVPPELDGRFVSNEYPTFTPRPEFCRSEWLFAYFKRCQVWTQLATGSKGIGARRERVRPEILLSQRIWVPPLTDQHRIAEVMTTQQCYSIVNKIPDDVALLRRTILSQAFRGDL
jgi:type I restriction enzyme S subunit